MIKMFEEEKKQIPVYYLPALKILIMPDFIYILKQKAFMYTRIDKL